ncbi:MAG: hypothetical protein Q9202_001868 [Teloschistes flavicans]
MADRTGPQNRQNHNGVNAADLASAITASLNGHQRQRLHLPQDRWRPESADDWQAYHNQKGLEEMYETEVAMESEEPELQEAIQRSTQDGSASTDKGKGRADAPQTGTARTTTTRPQSPARPTIDDRIKEIQFGTTATLPWQDDPSGDTWIFIDPPAQQPEQTPYMHRVYVDRYQKPLTIASAALKALHSDFFEKLLNPTSQHRTLRRRGLVGHLPEHIKYVIDLTPPAEGNDAAYLMTQLCCVEGVLHWSEAESRWQVAHMLVGGHDEFTISPKDSTLPPELSTIRHRSSIERVLAAIRGQDPNLDSAIKVYTTFAVARSFKIIHSPLTDYIVRWLRAPPNSLFIEVLPEVALEMGDGLQCHELIRDSFAVLTGERALDNIKRDCNNSYSVYGRKKYDVSENYQTRLEYASRSFVDRVAQTVANLVEPDMKWIEKLPHVQKVPINESGPLGSAANKLMVALKAFVRGAIFTVLYCNLKEAPQPYVGADGGDCLYPRIDLSSVWNMLGVKERMMTAMFWRALQEFWYEYSSNGRSTNLISWPRRSDEWTMTTNESRWSAATARKQWLPISNMASRTVMQQKHGVVEVKHDELAMLVDRMNAAAHGYDDEQILSLTWPRGLMTKGQHSNSTPAATKPDTLDRMWDSESSTPEPSEMDTTAHTSTQETSGSSATEGRIALDRQDVPNDPMDQIPNGTGFELVEFFRDVRWYIDRVCRKMTGPADDSRNEPMYQAITPTLLCLEESEWKYLPLYAGGLDDGSFGTFNDDVPAADAGFSTAGPSIHTAGSSGSAASSEFDVVGRNDLESTHHTSTVVHDGFSDQLDRHQVYDDDSAVWNEVMKHKDIAASSAISYSSHVETNTAAAPSTADAQSTIDAGSDDGFVLPLRPKASPSANGTQIQQPGAGEAQRGDAEPEQDLDDYSDIFTGDDDDVDGGDLGDDAEEDDDEANFSDAGTEKGEDGDDDDMVFV